MSNPVARNSPNTLVEVTGPLETLVISLGNRSDSFYWSTACNALATPIPTVATLNYGLPTIETLKDLFKTPAEWVYLAGHWFDVLGNACYKTTEDHYLQPRLIRFFNTYVQVEFYEGINWRGNDPTQKWELQRGSDFLLHEQCQVLMFGGCNVLVPEHVPIMRQLFGKQCLILGPSELTSIPVMNYMFGNHEDSKGKGFFDRIGANQNSKSAIRDAWLDTAKTLYVPPGGYAPFVERFRAVDPDGTEHYIDARGNHIETPNLYD